MSIKLVQKRLFGGTRELEILGDTLHFRFKSWRTEEKLAVVLSVLDPDPVVEKPYLHFHSRVKCDPLISLWIDKPDRDTFNAFVDTLSRRARDEFNSFAGLDAEVQRVALGDSVYTEPPEFAEPDGVAVPKRPRKVDPAAIDDAIAMLAQYLDGEPAAQPLVAALKALRDEPDNLSHLGELARAFNQLGIIQGAVLTYAPYVGALLSDDPYGER